MRTPLYLYMALAMVICSGAPALAQLPRGDAARGAKEFDAMSCAMCHPGGGNALKPEKCLKGPSFAKRYPTDADIARVIRTGVRGTPMDAFKKSRLSDRQLADIIAYIRSLTPKTAGKSNPAASNKQSNAASPQSKKRQTGSK